MAAVPWASGLSLSPWVSMAGGMGAVGSMGVVGGDALSLCGYCGLSR